MLTSGMDLEEEKIPQLAMITPSAERGQLA